MATRGRRPSSTTERLGAVVARAKSPLGIALIRDGVVSECRVHGTDASLFQVGSVSKSVAAAVVLRLAERGSIHLDTGVNQYLHSWTLPDGDGVTPRDLLGHTGGVGVPFFPGYGQGDAVPTIQQVLEGTPPANTAPVRTETNRRGRFHYSGGAFVILQQVVADVTGVPFAEAARALLFEPLGMKDTAFDEPLPTDRRDSAVTDSWHVYPETAAAGLWTTPLDLATYVCAILAGGMDQDSLLEQASAEMLRPHTRLPTKGEWGVLPLLGIRPPRAVGLGLFLHSATRFSHAGGAFGFFCMFTGSLADGSGGIVMQARRASPHPFRVLRAMSRQEGWSDFDTPWWRRPTGLPGLRRLA